MEYGIENLLDIDNKVIDKSVVQFRVRSKDIKMLFNCLSQFFKITELTRTISIEVEPEQIIVRASALAHFRMEIPIDDCVLQKPFKGTYVWKDLEKLIPGTGILDCTLTETFISMKCKKANIRLMKSITELPEINFDLDWVDTDVQAFTQMATNLKTLAPISKIYKRTPPICIKDGYAQILYPTVYVQVRAPIALSVTLDYQIIQLIANTVINAEMPLEFGTEGDTITFKCGNRYLSVAKIIGVESSDLRDQLERFTVIQNVSVNYFCSELVKMKQATGDGDITVYFTDTSCILEKTIEGNSIRITVGDTENTNASFQFTYKIELLTPILQLLGDSFILYKKGEVLCLKNRDSMIMISYQS